MSVSRIPTKAADAKELERINAALDRPGSTGPARLELLRRQAMIGDRRDARLERQRRSAD